MEFSLENEHFDDYIKDIKSLGKICGNENIDSSILKEKNIFLQFYNLLSSKIKINNIKQLYKCSKDGFGLNNLKDKINNKSNLIFLFQSGDSRIFGSFTKAKIEVKNNTYIQDEDAFAFSLNNNKIYKILIPKQAIRFYEGNSVKIGNTGNSNGFYISNGKIYDNGLLKSPKIYDFQKNYELTEGADKFIELEVFEIN